MEELTLPTIYSFKGCRFFFYSADGLEPRHIHVQKDKATAKYWLDPIRLSDSNGFSRQELHELEGIINTKIDSFRRSWDGFFGT
jgi:hypothetical protein